MKGCLVSAALQRMVAGAWRGAIALGGGLLVVGVWTAPGLAQSADFDEGRASDGDSSSDSSNNYSYAGLGISDEGWVVNSKAVLTPNLSARPMAIVDFDFDDVKLLVPVTYDFPAVDAGGAELLPFGGGGVSFSTEGEDHFNALVTGGVDYHLSEQWTATGSANLSFAGETDLDVTVGVGYRF